MKIMWYGDVKVWPYIDRDEMCKLLSDKNIDKTFREYVLEVVEYCESKFESMKREIESQNN